MNIQKQLQKQEENLPVNLKMFHINFIQLWIRNNALTVLQTNSQHKCLGCLSLTSLLTLVICHAHF